MSYLANGPDYDGTPLEAEELGDDPLTALQRWIDDAYAADVPQPNAMSLATATNAGRPSVRTVLLKAVDSGVVFYTNYGSRKADELEDNPWAAASLTWVTMHRQVRISGRVDRVTSEESDEYWATRPRGAQLAAIASAQSRVLSDRTDFEQAIAELDASEPENPDRPVHWGGYRLSPLRIEFWHGRASRMHDRIEYVLDGDTWINRRLYP